MRRDFSVRLVALSEELKTPDGKPLTLGAASIIALLQPYQDEPNLTGDFKLQRYQLAERIDSAVRNTRGLAEMKVEEIALLKQLIGKYYAPGVVGPAYAALERDVPEAWKSTEERMPYPGPENLPVPPTVADP